jgi:hypothetical protein
MSAVLLADFAVERVRPLHSTLNPGLGPSAKWALGNEKLERSGWGVTAQAAFVECQLEIEDEPTLHLRPHL